MHGSSASAAADAAERRPAARDLGALRTLLGLLRPYAWQVALAAVALVVAAGAVLAFGLVIREVVDRGFGSADPTALREVLALFLAVVTVMAVFIGLRVYLVNWLGERLVADLRQRVFARVLAFDIGTFESLRTGEIISRLTADTTLLQTVVGSTLAIAVRNALLILGGLVMLFVTSPKLTLVVLAGVPVVVLPGWLIGYRVRRLARTSQDRIADVAAGIDETLYGIRTVQAFCHEPIDRQAQDQRVEEAFAAAVRRAGMSGLLTVAVTWLTFGAIGVVLWLGGQDVLRGVMTGGELSAFVFFAVLVASSVGALSEVIGELLRALGATERLMGLLAIRPQIQAPVQPQPLPAPPLGRVRFEAVDFHYPSRPAAPVLQGFDLDLAPGETVALVGPSGAGKSTVLQLLLRFYDPSAGRILLDGVDLRQADPAAVRGRIALVPQEPVIFGLSAYENIRYGLEGVSDAAVEAAAAAAQALDFLRELPEGLHSYLGERGVRLSGGQRQRVAIARALLRDPAILLLDEATSALDAESERAVQQALEALMQGRTTLVIAHRLATVRRADRILVLDGGRIQAIGRHEELIAQNGLYARLARLQFREAEAPAAVRSSAS